jgi:glycogenin glucosyltransferase
MRGDGYLPGALVLGHALKLLSQHDRICLVTADVSEQARRALGCVYDKIIEINEIRIKNGITQGRKDRYILLTRFEALRIRGYDKIILLDADVLPLWGYDELFSLPAPAGIIMERKAECYAGGEATSDRWSWHDLYEPIYPHGAPIPKEITDRVRIDPSNMGVNAGLWVLHPSQREYDAVMSFLQKPDVSLFVKNLPWLEMQLATLLWSGRWTNIDIRYCSIGGYPHIYALYGIHFAGLKPWQIRNRSAAHYAKFPDFKLWQKYYSSVYWECPLLREYPALKRLWNFCNSNKKSPP